MPERIERYTYSCVVCGKEYTHRTLEGAQQLARECERSHGVMPVYLTKAEVISLLNLMQSAQFIDECHPFLSETLYRTLRKALRSY